MINIAIITPTVGYDWMLERACASVQKNVKSDLNITHFVIFDNVEIVAPKTQKYQNYRLVLLKNKDSRGPSATRNLGIYNITKHFDFFGFLDADDYLNDSYICNTLEKLSLSAATIAFGQGVAIDNSEDQLAYSNVPIKEGKVPLNLIAANIVGCPSGLILKNSQINRSVVFDCKLKYLEDYFYYLQLAHLHNSFLKTKERYFYQIHEKQSTDKRNIDQLNKQISEFIKMSLKLRFGIYTFLLIWLRATISRCRLSGNFTLTGLLALFVLSILCPSWALGRLAMRIKRVSV